MDFGELLHVAQKNSQTQKTVPKNKFYSTKYEPPKKESKDKKLSANIQKFLIKKEEEEKEKARLAQQKSQALYSQRDEKAKNKIRKMLKVTKSANRSVLEDAIDNNNTAYTLQGPEQPDEDDYGYTSQEATQLYRNLMNKYKNIPEADAFPKNNRTSVVKSDISSTKDRVRAALIREKEDDLLPHRRQRTNNNIDSSQVTSGKDGEHERHRKRNLYDPQAEREAEDERKRKESRSKRPPPVPALDFQQLLKLAEQKQFEPIEIQVDTKRKEPDRPMTSKEKRELEERNAYLAEREKRKSEAMNKHVPVKGFDERQSKTIELNKQIVNNPSGRIPKKNGYQQIPTTPTAATAVRSMDKDKIARELDKEKISLTKSTNKINNEQIRTKYDNEIKPKYPPHMDSKKSNNLRPINSQNSNRIPSNHSIQNKSSDMLKKPNNTIMSSNNSKSQSLSQNVKDMSSRNVSKTSIPEKTSKPLHTTNGKIIPPKESKSQQISSSQVSNRTRPTTADVKSRQFPPDNVKTRQFPPTDVKSRPPADVKTRQFPPADIKTRQFPPADVKTRQFPPADIKSRQFPPNDVRRDRPKNPPPLKRRRIESDSEYDSEMDDFIDDGPVEGDYSKYIKEIFGYDKSRYRDMDDDDADNMESSFSQQMREEFHSKKMGLMEDLEDMRLEAEEKKRKKKKVK